MCLTEEKDANVLVRFVVLSCEGFSIREFELRDGMGHFQAIITFNRYTDLFIYVLVLEETSPAKFLPGIQLDQISSGGHCHLQIQAGPRSAHASTPYQYSVNVQLALQILVSQYVSPFLLL